MIKQDASRLAFVAIHKNLERYVPGYITSTVKEDFAYYVFNIYYKLFRFTIRKTVLIDKMSYIREFMYRREQRMSVNEFDVSFAIEYISESLLGAFNVIPAWSKRKLID